MDADMTPATAIGIVVIGRNEGERLKQCLQSLPSALPTVYVDSGSIDGSVEFAHSLAVSVVELDMDMPFTAARARNVGWKRLVQDCPNLDAVQFVDGDCQIHPDWLSNAADALFADERIAVVFGRRRERYPDASIYNRMCDDEWDVPIGPANACGGDALFRLTALSESGGYSDELIAGEEPDLCLRMRKRGWAVQRIDAEMTLHDAAIYSWRAWWLRSQRAGFAYANHVWKHRKNADQTWVRQVFSILYWAGMLPIATTAILVLIASGKSFLSILIAVFVAVVYIIQIGRMFKKRCVNTCNRKFALEHSIFTLLGKLPQFVGVLMFARSRLPGGTQALIEYKGDA